MKKHAFLFCTFFLFFVSLVQSQDRGFGLGIILGSPTGISGKYWVTGSNAVDFGFGYSFARHGGRLHLHADYLWHSFNIIRSSERFPIYYGIGGRFKVRENDDGSLGIRGVIGLNWLSRTLPLDVFLEVAPIFRIFPSTSLDFDAGLGARFWFN